MAEVKRRESRAGQFYQRSLAEAAEERIKEIFAALIEIEADHLTQAERMLAP